MKPKLEDEDFTIHPNPDGTMGDANSTLVKCAGCGNVMSVHSIPNHRRECTLLHMKNVLDAKRRRKG